jgi:hypothetical protein
MLAFLALLVFADQALAQADGADGAADRSASRSDARWIPGFSAEAGFLTHRRDGYASSEERGRVEGDTNSLFGVFGVRTEISSPRITSVPSAPRVFGYAGVSMVRDKDESIANEGEPGDPLLDLDNKVDANNPVAGIVGTGTSLRVESEPVIYSGGLGASFETEIASRVVRFRPTLDWTYQRDRVELAFADAEGQGSDPSRCNPCQITSLQAQTEKGYHSLGPGLEIDLDAGRLGDFVLTVFTRFQSLRTVGDRETSLDATSSWFTRQTAVIDGETVITSIDPVPGREDSVVTSRYRREPWSFYGAAGVRLLWSPE